MKRSHLITPISAIAALNCLLFAAHAAEPAPLRVAVLGCGPNGADASATVAALVDVDRERGITINTSHVEYQTVNRGTRSEFVESACTVPFSAAVLTSSGPDPSVVLEAARLTQLAGVQPAYVLLAGRSYSDDQIAALQKGLVQCGYDASNSGIFVASLDQAPCPSDPTVAQLRDAIDAGATRPDPQSPFELAVDETLTTSAGLTSYGLVFAGSVQVGDPVEIIGFAPKPLRSTVTGIEMFRKILDRGEAGDNVGLLLRGIDKKDIRRGMVIVKPGSVRPHSKVQAEVYVLKKEEGGRHTPFQNKYRPQFYFRGTDVTGEIELPDGRDMIAPGDNVTITVNLINPIAMDKGLRFAIREGGRTVGAGQVTEILK
ncbi:MAG: EF-Tu/IF-2/RF-3 family GTPase [Akkermansiaceae bacterium]|jgi:elongation factor Tu|nr:EF-Tu/IF-2/RF-3 family GTPase [Akkermansiaceae bacterium]